MGYDHGYSYPFDFESNGIPFSSKSKGKLSPRSHPIQYKRNWKYSFLSVAVNKFRLRKAEDRRIYEPEKTI